MGCNWSDNHIPHWKNIKFKRFRGKDKLNAYFTYLRKTFVTDLLQLAEQIENEREQLLEVLNMSYLELYNQFPYKPELRDVTLALFYAFNTYSDGKMTTALEMKFYLNVFLLSDSLRACWKEFGIFVGALCTREKEIEILDEQYPKIYEDTINICQQFFSDVQVDPFSPNVSRNHTLNYNMAELQKCRDCIKDCFGQVNRDFKGIKGAIFEVKRTPKTMKRIADVCKVDNLTQPWECFTKIARLRNLNIKPHKETEFQDIKKQLNKQKYKEQREKQQKLLQQQKETELKEIKQNYDTNLLFDKLGKSLQAVPLTSQAPTDFDKQMLKFYNDPIQADESKSPAKSRSLSMLNEDTIDSPSKIASHKMDFVSSSLDVHDQKKKSEAQRKAANQDFEDVNIIKSQSSKDKLEKNQVESKNEQRKLKKKKTKKPQKNKPSNNDDQDFSSIIVPKPTLQPAYVKDINAEQQASLPEQPEVEPKQDNSQAVALPQDSSQQDKREASFPSKEEAKQFETTQGDPEESSKPNSLVEQNIQKAKDQRPQTGASNESEDVEDVEVMRQRLPDFASFNF